MKSLIRIKDFKVLEVPEFAVNNLERYDMDTITSYLSSDHRHCDDLFIEAETCVSTDRWDDAQISFHKFRQALEHHFVMEENILFPEFESAIGGSGGPTSIMRSEHLQMRNMVGLLQDALTRRDADDFLGNSDTLNIMMQQHNMKEESVLYLMADRALSGKKDEVIDAMNHIDALV